MSVLNGQASPPSRHFCFRRVKILPQLIWSSADLCATNCDDGFFFCHVWCECIITWISIMLTNMINSRNQIALIRPRTPLRLCPLSWYCLPSHWIYLEIEDRDRPFIKSCIHSSCAKNIVCHKTDYVFSLIMCIVGEKRNGRQCDGGDEGGAIGRTLIKVRCMRLYESENMS